MNEEELKALVAKVEEATGEKITEEVKNQMKDLDVAKVNELLKKDVATTEDVQALKSLVDSANETIAQLKEDSTTGSERNASFRDQLEKALKEAMPTLKDWKQKSEDSKKELIMTIKAPVDMTTGAIDNASGVDTPVNYVYQNVVGYANDVRPDAYIINFIDNGTTDRATIPYMDKLPNEGTMEVTAEGALKPLISFSFELNYSQADKIAGRIKVSEEALDDINGLMTMIQNELKYEHDIAEQNYIFTEINSIAPAFVAGDLAASTDEPSNYDAIRAAIYSVKIASNGKYMPNLALVPSSDVYNMGATKDANNNYVLPPFVLPDGTRVSGVRILEVNDSTVAAGSFIVGDFRRLKRRVYKSFTIRMGQGIVGSATAADIASDFEKNMYTVIGESRQHLYIYENEKVAFVKATFAAVKTAIETTP